MSVQQRASFGRRATAGVSLAVLGTMLGGCVGSPTYGTGTTANQQLASDVTNVLQIGPKKRNDIEYKPRAELVRPAPGTREALPEPQRSVASADNADWPESPEQRRARIRAEATANQDDPTYQSEVVADGSVKGSFSPKVGTSPRREQRMVGVEVDSTRSRSDFNQKLAQSRQGDPNSRRYLSEPPLAYRQPADNAPVNDVGEDEWKKERRLKAEAKKKSGGSSGWFDWLPGT